MATENNTNAKVMGGIVLIGGLAALWYLFFRNENKTLSGAEKKPTKYYSKWRNKWVKFKRPPTDGEIAELKKYKYNLKGIEVQLFKRPTISDIQKGSPVVYKDTSGEFSKIGVVTSISEGLVTVGGGTYTPDELRLIKK